MTVVVLLYRTKLPPYSVKTCPWCIRTNKLPKLPEELQLLLFAEHHLASGTTLELQDKFGFLSPKLLLDLSGHAIEPSGDLLLISAREPNARALLYLTLYGHRAVGQVQLRYASNYVLFVFDVAGSSETQRKRYGVTQPVALF